MLQSIIMEKLSDLPLADDDDLTPQEKAAMTKHFGSAKPKTKSGWRETFKLVCYTLIIFLMLANPWVDSFFCMVPYCGSSAISLLGLKAVLFTLFFVLVLRYT